MPIPDSNKYRQTMLQVIEEYSRGNSSSLQSRSTLHEVARRLQVSGDEVEQLILTIWGDLFRTGYLAWGLNVTNPDPPFCHVTERGRNALKQFSRDPANPEGYLTYLSSSVKLNAITESYVHEALQTFIADCYKASAVMIGAASENLILELRDSLLQKMQTIGKPPPSELQDWKIKQILNGLKREFDAKRKDIPKQLLEEYEGYWSAFTQQIRAARNDAGHPSELSIVTFETVHASLLVFPALAILAEKLKTWIMSEYV
jgi:hypothetical protein